MDETNSLIAQRRAKLDALRAKGIDPFKNKFSPTEKCTEARDNYAEGREVSVAGRVTAHRDMGKSMFIDVRDQSGRIQVYAQKNVLVDEQFDIFRHLDLGDFIGAKGMLFTTKTGEISIKLSSFVSNVIDKETQDKIDVIKGINISFVTTAKTDDEGRALLTQLGMPFRA